MKRFRITIAVLTLAVFVATAAVLAVNGLKSDEPEVVSVVKAADSEDGYTTFYVPDGENFEILALTDTQVKYPLNNYETDYGGSNENTFTLVKRLVESANPDLVIITGDLVMSQFVNNMAYFRRYAELFEELETYWAFTFGNHDAEWTVTDGAKAESTGLFQSPKSYVIEELSVYEHCLTEAGDAADGGGTGNYVINVRGYDSSLIYSLFMADCVNNGDEYLRYKSTEQVERYERHIRTLNAAEYGENAEIAVKSMLFTHVPLPEFFESYNIAAEGGDAEIVYGHYLEGNPASKGFELCVIFDKILELGSTSAVFAGHYHDNDFMVRYKGVDMVFVQHSGVAHYYRMDADDVKKQIDMSDIHTYGDERGGTVIDIGYDGEYRVSRFLAAENVEYDDIKIDYDAVANDLKDRGWEVDG